jgi:hypothetical protein
MAFYDTEFAEWGRALFIYPTFLTVKQMSRVAGWANFSLLGECSFMEGFLVKFGLRI